MIVQRFFVISFLPREEIQSHENPFFISALIAKKQIAIPFLSGLVKILNPLNMLMDSL